MDDQNERKIVIISITACLILVVILNMIILLSAKRHRDSSYPITTTSQVSPFITQGSKSPLTFTESPRELQKLKAVLTSPIKANNLTIEYRKNSNTWIIFYNGDKTVAEKNVADFFTSHNVSIYSSEVFDYISLDPPKETGEK